MLRHIRLAAFVLAALTACAAPAGAQCHDSESAHGYNITGGVLAGQSGYYLHMYFWDITDAQAEAPECYGGVQTEGWINGYSGCEDYIWNENHATLDYYCWDYFTGQWSGTR